MLEFVLAAVVSISQIDGFNIHREWMVSCDSQHACSARATNPETAPGALKAGLNARKGGIGVVIHRDSGANAAPRIRFLPCDHCAPEDGPDPANIRELTVLDATGKTIFALQLSAREARRANTPAGLAFPADSGLFLAMALGETLNLGDTFLQGYASVSLGGARDALRAMGINQQ